MNEKNQKRQISEKGHFNKELTYEGKKQRERQGVKV